MKYYFIVGEASGDLHASNLMRELKKLDSNATFRFWGGDLMAEQGGEMVRHYRETAYMGIFEVLKHLPKIFKNLNFCEKDIEKFNPDVVVLVDYAGFNLRIAKRIKKMKIPAYYYILPKIWASSTFRVHKVKKYIDKLFCIMPFEPEFYARYGVTAHYSGNPVVDAIDAFENKNETFEQFIKRNNLPDKPIIGIVAGSRVQEVSRILPDMLSMTSYFPDFQFIVAGAPSFSYDDYKPYLNKYQNVTVLFNETYSIMKHSHCAMVTSGTATLEAALLNCPQVVCYKMSGGAFSDFVAKKILIKIPYISLVNIILNKEAVKELFQRSFSIEKLKNELNLICNNETYRQEMFNNYNKLAEIMGNSGSSRMTAEMMWEHFKLSFVC